MDTPTGRSVADLAPSRGPSQRRLFRLLWLSIAAAVALVNLVAALVAIGALRWASKPADEEHAYGHAKAEYFSAGAEGALIVLAAVSIAVVSIERLLNPRGLEDVGAGLAVSAAA